MPTNFTKKKADREPRPEPALSPVDALKKAVGERSEEMEMSRITIDQALQVREHGLDAETVERYRVVIREGGELPPVTLYRTEVDSQLVYLLAAGFHRMEAHRLENRTIIQAVVRQGSREDAMIEAARSNLAHGLDLKKPDLRRALEILLLAGYYLKDGVLASNAVIASDLGVSAETVSVWAKEISTLRNLRVDFTRRWGKDGKVRDVESIQESNQQRAEDERKRKEQERFQAQVAADAIKLERYRTSNVIFRAKFVADMLLHSPTNRNIAARLKIELPSENTPEEHKTFGYYLKAADKRFTISTDRENQFIRDFQTTKDVRWYQTLLAAVTPSIWEAADAQNWDEAMMQEWLDGFHQRQSAPLPSAAPNPGMAQPKGDATYPQTGAISRHRLTTPAHPAAPEHPSEPPVKQGKVSDMPQDTTATEAPPTAYQPSNGTQQRMAENYATLIQRITHAITTVQFVPELDCNIQYMQTPEVLESIWDSIQLLLDHTTAVSQTMYDRLHQMASTGLPYDADLAAQTLKEGKQRA